MAENIPTNTAPLYAKQPLFNRDMTVIGYELLFRPQENLTIVNGNNATAQVLLNIFTSDDPVLNNESLAIYVNFTSDWILQGVPIDRANCVIEVLEDVKVTPALANAIRGLRRSGFKIALDDFDLSLSTSLLLPEADIVKIDVLSLSKSEIKNTLQVLKGHEVNLVAEKVETQEMFEWALEQGFDIFQGYFFCRPEQRLEKLVKPPKNTTMSLLASLMSADVELDDIAKQLKTDPVLTVKLLQLVNNSRYSRLHKVKNLQEAVVVLGIDQLKKWVAMIALTDLDNKPHELIRVTLVCAYAMESFATSLCMPNAPSPSDCFFIGFLSKLDAYFDRPLVSVVAQLPLDASIVDAVVHRNGAGGQLLNMVDSLMVGQWDILDQSAKNIRVDELFKTYLASEQQADMVYKQLI